MVLNKFVTDIVISRNGAVLVHILSCIKTPNCGTEAYMRLDFLTSGIYDRCGWKDIWQSSPLETEADNSKFLTDESKNPSHLYSREKRCHGCILASILASSVASRVLATALSLISDMASHRTPSFLAKLGTQEFPGYTPLFLTDAQESYYLSL